MSNTATVVIDGNTFAVYGDTDFVDDYMAGAIHGATWGTQDDTTKAKACVSATRLIDRQVWRGNKTSVEQELAFPRSGLFDASGAAVASDDIPQAVFDAFCELCLALVDGSEVQTSTTTESNIGSLTAGAVSVTFWRGAGSVPGRFPTIVQELMGRWLAASGSGAVGASAFGTDGCSAFTSDFGINDGV